DEAIGQAPVVPLAEALDGAGNRLLAPIDDAVEIGEHGGEFELLYGAEPLGCAGHPPLPFRSGSSMSRSQPAPGLMARGGKDDDIRRNVHPPSRETAAPILRG